LTICRRLPDEAALRRRNGERGAHPDAECFTERHEVRDPFDRHRIAAPRLILEATETGLHEPVELGLGHREVEVERQRTRELDGVTQATEATEPIGRVGPALGGLLDRKSTRL